MGTGAEIDLDYEKAFVFGQSAPMTSSVVVAGGGGFVIFAQVAPGETEVRALPAEGYSCMVFPSESQDTFTLSVVANQVSLVAFTCRETEN